MKMNMWYMMLLNIAIMQGILTTVCDCKQKTRRKRSPEAIQPMRDASLADNAIKLSPYALSPLTLCEAIRETTHIVKTQQDDVAPANEQQRGFLDKQYLPYVKEKLFNFFSAEELQSYASRDYQELNKILKSKGFALQFPQFPRTQIGVLAIQDVLVKWLLEGTKEPLSVGDATYDGVMLKVDVAREDEQAGQQNVHFFAQDPQATVIVKLLTQSKDCVYFVTQRNGDLFASQPTEAAIAEVIMKYRKHVSTGTYAQSDRFNSLHFPMISYDVNPDVSWLERMRIGTTYVAQAMQQVIFKMNEQGARAKAAAGLIVATSFREKDPQERLIIDKPFLVWIERPGVPLPIFAGYMTQSYWKNPGAL
jgi:hypothetical protein